MKSTAPIFSSQTRPPKFVAQYLFGEQVGEGSYGKVKEAFDSETLQRVAIKIMKRARLKKIPNGEENVKREISLMRRLKHPNVVQLLEVLYNDEKKKMYVVLEFCSGNLQDVIENAEGKKLGPGQTQE
jgi:serine/threonine-protein kinase 11